MLYTESDRPLMEAAWQMMEAHREDLVRRAGGQPPPAAAGGVPHVLAMLLSWEMRLSMRGDCRISCARAEKKRIFVVCHSSRCSHGDLSGESCPYHWPNIWTGSSWRIRAGSDMRA